MSDDTNTTYGFAYKDCDNKIYKQEITIEDVTWQEVLNDFVTFLEGIYGYEIKPSIRLEEPFWMNSPFMDVDTKAYFESHGWKGEFFSKEEDE